MVNNLSENKLKKMKTPIYGVLHNEAFPYNHEDYFNDIFNENKRKRLNHLQSLNEKILENDDNLIQEMTSLFKEIKSYESTNKDLLIELLNKYIFEKYKLDEEIIEINSKLNDKLKSIKNTEDVILEFDDFESVSKHNGKIKQRLILDSIIDGSSRDYRDFIHDNYSELANINPLLPMKYSRLGSMASYLPYTQDSNNLKDGGDFLIDYPKTENGKIKINCVGVDLLSLFYSLNKAILTLVVNNSLNSRIEEDLTTIKESIKNKYDHFISDHVWECFKTSLNKINEDSSHLILHEMGKMDLSEFNQLMKEILYKTKKSKVMVDELVNEINFNINN